VARRTRPYRVEEAHVRQQVPSARSSASPSPPPDHGPVGSLDETDEAPRMTQLPRVQPKSAFHFRSTPSSVPARCGGAVAERSTSEREWWTGGRRPRWARAVAWSARRHPPRRGTGSGRACGDAVDQDARDVHERAAPAASAWCGGEPGTADEEEGGGSSR